MKKLLFAIGALALGLTATAPAHADYIRSAFGLLQLLFGEAIIYGSYQTQKTALGPSQHLPQKSAELHALASEGRQHASDPSNLVPVSDLWRRIQTGAGRDQGSCTRSTNNLSEMW